ncbi:MAG: PASTA domain-containing protein, partial [Firmicutes bacterium]|nr:PASTA domain-containing protein [Bacillota bacterium]
GQVPYVGESPVSIAVKHMQEPFPNALDFNPDIPDAVNRIIRKAVEKVPDNRFHSAKEMADELTNWLQGRESRISIMDPAPISGGNGVATTKKTKKQLKRGHIIAIVAGILMLALFIFGVFRLLKVFNVPDVDVPQVEGERWQEAATILEEAGLQYHLVDQIASDTVPAGHVIRQDPAAGKTVKKNREIELTVSTGPELVTVDSVVGKMRREAEIILKGSDFDVEVLEIHSEELPGVVISQDPGGGYRILKGSTVTLRVSKGGQPFKLRDLVGYPLEDAENWLKLYDLIPRRADEKYNDDFGAGLIYDQFPEANELVQAGDYVDLYVSKGPEEPELEEHKITIKTNDIPEGETITVIIRDEAEERTETYISTGEPIITTGWGSGTVEVSWGDQTDTKTFP